MSSIVKHNDLITFGVQNPFYRVITEAGIKETFLHLLLDRSSKVARKRSFSTYLLANKVFINNNIVINENLKSAISQFITPFLKLSVRNDITSLLNIKRSNYLQAEIYLTNELAKVLKVRRILAICCDSEKTTLSNQKGITTYITRGLKESENTPLEASWTNGFFAFNSPDSLSILVIIPKQYLANMMINLESERYDSVSSYGSNIDLLESMRDEMIIDLIKSFFAAIFSDGYRNRINTDIISLNSIFQESGSVVCTSADNPEAVFNELLSKYRNRLVDFKESDCENLVYECMKMFKYQSHVTINPFEFYNGFIDISYSYMQYVFKRLPIFNIVNNKNVQSQIASMDFSNNLSSMNTFFVDERDTVIYGLKLVRFLPFFIFNTYVLGGGNYHNQMLQTLSNVSSFLSTLGSFKNTSILYGPFTSFLLDELNYLINDFAKQMESPLKINNKSRHLMIDLIASSVRPTSDEL
jgi:hypothetical protein